MNLVKILISILDGVSAALFAILIAGIVVILAAGVFLGGYIYGFNDAAIDADNKLASLLFNLEQKIQLDSTDSEMGTAPEPAIIYVQREPTAAPPTWTGPELWEVVNKRRVEFGVGELSSVDEICTIASLRLNQLLELGKLDGHEGFSNLPEEREDVKWIFDKYNLSEFLLFGAQTPEQAVSLWENTLGHKKLLTGGEFVWGCIYAQNSFAVAIAAF